MTDATHLFRGNAQGEILDASGQVVGRIVPPNATKEWVAAYLSANGEYWRIQDAQALPPMKWRKGTPAEATAYGYEAALSAAPADWSSVAVRVPERKAYSSGDGPTTRTMALAWNSALDAIMGAK